MSSSNDSFGNAIVVGASGRLGAALVSEYEQRSVRVPREHYRGWGKSTALGLISEYLSPYKNTNSTVFIAAGLMNPKLDQADLDNVNYHLPSNVISVAQDLGIRVVTFGTVLENLANDPNRYVRSKIKLANEIRCLDDSSQTLHVQIHTLYGAGIPSEYMFLGLIYNALRSRSRFEMTSGRQLREYHHVVDEAKAVHHLESGGFSGVLDLSHGNPIQLREIAVAVFSAFDCGELLGIGELDEPKSENYEHVFQRHPVMNSIQLRDSVPAIVEYLKSIFLSENVS
jgi:nucleoside-diphosphate-sugar epimerase